MTKPLKSAILPRSLQLEIETDSVAIGTFFPWAGSSGVECAFTSWRRHAFEHPFRSRRPRPHFGFLGLWQLEHPVARDQGGKNDDDRRGRRRHRSGVVPGTVRERRPAPRVLGRSSQISG